LLGLPQHNNKDNTSKDTEKKILLLLADSQSYEKGFSLLVQTYQERLYWHIRQMLDAHDAADEVLQNTFIKIYKGIANFRGDAQLYTWLYRIASNECLTFLSKKKKTAFVDFDSPENNVANTLQSDDYFDSEGALVLLQKAIDTLPEKQKEVFIMRYYDELSYNEIAAMTGITEGGLKASYHHAVKKIEEYIKNKI
jgi:RNA polymerase sigma-70 factor (ECF subfamily)